MTILTITLQNTMRIVHFDKNFQYFFSKSGQVSKVIITLIRSMQFAVTKSINENDTVDTANGFLAMQRSQRFDDAHDKRVVRVGQTFLHSQFRSDLVIAH